MPYRFKPYFYGPFSIEISNALPLLESFGLINSEEKELSDDLEVRQTVYSLTDSGEKAARATQKSYSEFSSRFENCFNEIRNTGYHQNTRVLATAAKVKLIVSQEGQPLTNEMIMGKAQSLGWEINDSDIEAAIYVLKETGLISIVKSKL
jgi:uncharacterized protein YwgA